MNRFVDLLADAHAGHWQRLPPPAALAGLDPPTRIQLRELMLADGRIETALALGSGDPVGAPTDACLDAALRAHLRRDYLAAERFAAQAIAADPGLAAAHNQRGRALHNLGRSAEALQCFRTALDCDPGFAPAAHNLAFALRGAGDLPQATAWFERAVALRPAYRSAHLNLGKTQLALRRFAPARAGLQRWLERAPDDAEALADLGLCHLQTGDDEQALRCLERATACDPRYPLAWLYLGMARNRRFDTAGAEAALREATRLAPRDPEAWSELASLLEADNRLDAMAEALQQGLGVAPGDAGLQLAAAVLARRRHRSDDALARLRSIDARALPERLLMRYRFELGRTLDARGESVPAWAAFVEANRLARTQMPVTADRAADLRRRLAKLGAWLRRTDLRQDLDGRSASAAPAFLLGFPRSGQTLLRTLLAAHPQVETLEERPTVEACIAQLEAGPGSYPEALDGIAPAALDALRATYWDEVARAGVATPPSRRLLDVHPYRAPHAALIRRLFPAATVVHLLRHPCDVVLSAVMQPLSASPANWHFQRIEDAVEYYLLVMECWDAAFAQLSSNVLRVRYEELVAEPERQLRRLCDGLGLAWDPGVLDQRRSVAAARVTTSSYYQVAEPLHRQACDRWRRYRFALDPVLQRLAPLASRYGYRID